MEMALKLWRQNGYIHELPCDRFAFINQKL